jgi:site-specific recombinase XerD
VKVGADLLKVLRSWIAAAGLQPSDPLFPAMGKGDRVLREKAMSTQGIADVVKDRVSSALGEEWRARISPHSLRHSFITIALQAGCPLHRVQYTVGHADPRTTERYDRLRESLEDNAADYVAKALAAIS